MRTKRPVMCDNKRILFSFLVIALSAVIAVNCISDQKPPEESGLAAKAATVVDIESSSSTEQKASDQIAAKQAEQPVASGSPEPASAPTNAQPDKQIEPKSSPQEASKVDSEAAKRKARSEQSSTAAASTSEVKPPADKASSPKAAAVPEAKSTTKAAGNKPVAAAAAAASATAAAAPTSTTSASSTSTSSTKLAAKSKLPANLGTVTSTGSGGNSGHYRSKHDAYSAIAEKHGSFMQDSMRKSDKRQLQGGFSGIQKAGGLSDVFGPFKSVSDSGLARTLGASMRSIMKGKYSVPAYVASALLGAVALMAFYESPISPLPVPALPEPPVGRFPPEMPNISPNTQVPFRTNQQQQFNQQQQNYNQRSLYSGIPQSSNGQSGYNFGQQAQQVLFPGSNNAQQRSQATSGPVQLAANLLGKQQTAQRKSGVDYDQSTSRSFFSPTGPANNPPGAQPKQGTGVGSASVGDNGQQKHNSLLNFFGLGGFSGSPAGDLPSAGKMAAQAALAAAAATNVNGNQVGQMSAINSLEPKGQSAGGLYNSNFVNKFKSFFTRSPQPASATSTFLNGHPMGPYDQYQRMSFVQALLKDSNFLPGFLTPSRKFSSTPTGSSQSASSSSASNKLQMVSNAIASATSGTSPTARMQVAGDLSGPSHLGNVGVQQAANNKPKQTAASGYGFAKAADRIAHVLLDTFTSGMAQRSAAPSNSQSDNSRKSSHDDISHSGGSSPISSILTDVISSAVYSAATAAGEQQQQSSNSEQVAPKSASQQQQSSAQQQSASSQQSANGPANSQDTSASGRSMDAQPVAESRISNAAPVKQESQPQTSAAPSEPAGHVRKTRSIGMDYAIESNQELNQREQQPSKAAQINSYIDLIADSYSQNRFLFNFVMNRVGLSHAVPYVEQILAPEGTGIHH